MITEIYVFDCMVFCLMDNLDNIEDKHCEDQQSKLHNSEKYKDEQH
jgi:hypothetical protein